MELKTTQEVINKFRTYVIQQSRSNLTKGGKNVTKGLYDSLKSEVLKEKDYFLIGFSMDEYGAYQDKGVKGKYKSDKAPNSPYKFGSGKGQKGGLRKGIEKWVVQKGIQFRDKKSGRFISYQSTALIISRSIYFTGIKGSFFFTKPFEAGYRKYINTDLVKAFAADIDTILSFNLKKK